MKLINPELRIENTNLCNANCIICTHDRLTRPLGIMDTRFFKELVSQGKSLGIKMVSPFGFGEPFIDKGLEDKVKICSDLGLETFITTNGSLCTIDRIQKIFEYGLTHLRFSVHGLNKVDYEKTMRGLNWDKVITNVTDAIDFKKKAYPDRKISITVIPMQGEQCFEIREAWESTVDWLEIWQPHNWSSQKDYRKKTKRRRQTCNRPQRGPIQIQWDGKVIPCCFLTDGELILGDTHKKSIEEIVKGGAYNELRQRHTKGNLNGLICQNCDQLNIEEINPLLYSNRDTMRCINTTSSTKFNLNK